MLMPQDGGSSQYNQLREDGPPSRKIAEQKHGMSADTEGQPATPSPLLTGPTPQASLPEWEPHPQRFPQSPPSSDTAIVSDAPSQHRDIVGRRKDVVGESYFEFHSSLGGSGNASQPSLTVSLPATPGGWLEESHASPPQDPPVAPPQASGTWRRPPTSDPATARQGSVPDPEHAFKYPDQTFAGLGPQFHASPSPPSRMPPRSSSSHSPHRSQSSVNDAPRKGSVQSHNGARTAGNTPAQSPCLFPPPVRSPAGAFRKHPPDSEDGRPPSQVLQAANLNPPLETHKLNKDFDPVSGRKILNNYELIEKLGSGQHGTVKRGKNIDTGNPVAVKIVRRFSKKLRLGKTGDPSDSIKKEVAILKKARHPHVVSLYEVIDDPDMSKVYLVLEFVERSEIVWRKKAEKTIGLFEKERMAREYSQGYDEIFEWQAVQAFNADVDVRRKEKEEYVESQKRQAREQLITQRQRPGSLWSPEHVGHLERDPTSDDHVREQRMSRADAHAAEHHGNSPESATPIHSTQALSHTLNTQSSISHPSHPSSAMSSVANSRTVSQSVSRSESPGPSVLDGTVWGSSDEPVPKKTKSDLEFQKVLDRIIADQDDNWYHEAEEYQYVPCLTLAQASDAFRDTVLGIEYLHYQGIIHRDIKPANLLWTYDYRVKISDFGVSYLGKPIREDSEHDDLPEISGEEHDEALELAKTVGTPAFYAPELCNPDIFDPEKRLERPAITGQIDVWALGVTLYCMVFGRLPFFDYSEFRMYEKIARDGVFVPRLRLKGVSHTDKTPSNHNKRVDDVLEYEEVDDTLRDLLRRLLIKDPAKRITLKEVKHHPWVIGAIEDKDRWLDETDPSRHSEGKKIEVSHQEVQDAVVGLNLFDRLNDKFQKLLGRKPSSRRRGTSFAKKFDLSSSVSASGIEERRTSLKGDEQTQILSSLKHSRETTEHPLAHSVAASPGSEASRDYFGDDGTKERSHSALEADVMARPSTSGPSMSTTDSMKTITARDPIQRQSVLEQRSESADNLANTTHNVGQNPSASNLGGILGGASRRIANSLVGRSRERGLSRQSPSQTSRSSSVDTSSITNIAEDYHASPSLGFSSAIAAGHLEQHPALREEAEEYELPEHSSTESMSLNRVRSVNQRWHQAEFARHSGAHRRSVSYAPDTQSPPTPQDDTPFHQQRPASAAESCFAISSSSDQIVSSDSAAHSRIHSVVSGTSSLSAPIDEEPKFLPARSIANSISPAIARPCSGADLEETISADPAIAKARAQQEEEAGYNGGAEEQDSDSEDEGLAMA